MRSRGDLFAGCGIPVPSTARVRVRLPDIGRVGVLAIPAILATACSAATSERSSATAAAEVTGVVAATRPLPAASPALVAIEAAVGRQPDGGQMRTGSPAAAYANEVIVVLDGDGGTMSLVVPGGTSVAVGEHVRVGLTPPARLLGPAP
jgi:hypothetical protein